MKKEQMTPEALFFPLLKSGLWGTAPVCPSAGDLPPDMWKSVLRIAGEQTVTGLIADGADGCPPHYVPMQAAARLMSLTLAIEKRNSVTDARADHLAGLFAEAGIPVVMIKGQAVARDYIRPERRMPGDIDLVVRPADYEAAKAVLTPLATHLDKEEPVRMHFGAMLGDLEVEIHGSIHTGLGRKVNEVLDEAQEALFSPDGHRLQDGRADAIWIPSVDFDALFVFVHLLQHFYYGGLGLRQLCDWARVLHTGKGSIDTALLTSRLERMGIVSEWKAFTAFLVKYLGLPVEDAVAYDPESEAKADRLWKFIRRVGNFGRNRGRRDRSRDPMLIRKTESLFLNSVDFMNHFTIFPLDSGRFFFEYIRTGLRNAIREASSGN